MSLWRKLASTACGAGALSLAACTSMPGGAKVVNPTGNPGTEAFQGVLPTAGPNASKPRYVLVVHGMGKTSKTYADDIVGRIKEAGYTLEASQDWKPVPLAKRRTVTGEAFVCGPAETKPPCVYDSFGSYRVDRFRAGERRVVMFTYYWDADLAALQDPFFAEDLKERHAAINGALKRDVVDLGFGDAAAYLGPAGGLVREGIEGAVCAMLRDAASSAQPAGACRLADLGPAETNAIRGVEYSFISISIGSRMLYDVLSAPSPPTTETPAGLTAGGEPTAVRALAKNTRNFFMLANQLPLLALGEVTVSDASRAAAGFTSGDECAAPRNFFKAAACERRTRPGELTSNLGQLEVVAFHDPDDLLGFRASGAMAKPDQNGVRFIEVSNRNTPVWLGMLAMPQDAHATEMKRAASARLILCGAQLQDGGRLKAEDCHVGK